MKLPFTWIIAYTAIISLLVLFSTITRLPFISIAKNFIFFRLAVQYCYCIPVEYPPHFRACTLVGMHKNTKISYILLMRDVIPFIKRVWTPLGRYSVNVRFPFPREIQLPDCSCFVRVFCPFLI